MTRASPDQANAAAEGRNVPLLTIAIPTFNRAGPLARQLTGLAEPAANGLVEVLVIDDGSHDSTTGLADELRLPGVRILRNPRNLGYGLNFCRLFAECRSPWMLVSADDDEIDARTLEPLVGWLRGRSPDFASTQWLTWEGALYRGRQAEGAIAPKDFRQASAHAPGLVYRTEACRPFLPEVERLVRAGDPLATLYPQVALAAHLMLEGRCLWYPEAVVHEGSGLPSQLVDASGRVFDDPGGRIAQLIALDRMLVGLRTRAGPEARRRLETMIRQNARGFYWSVRESFRAGASAECARRLDHSAFVYLLKHLGPLGRPIRRPRRAVSRAPAPGGA
jgi:glycosyltransferase involved in cell wall biosynthesis